MEQVFPEPEVTTFSSTDDTEFVMLASDGLFEGGLTNKEAIQCVRQQLRRSPSRCKS